MHEDLFRRLLSEGEGPCLDYKAEHYAIVSPDDDGAAIQAKAELIKDIVAMVNAYRDAPAYILIGVQELAGQPAVAVGISSHYDDATIQQIVLSKLNRPAAFQYSEFEADGVRLAVIEIPVQQRPVYLNRRYGHLHQNAAYIRRGTSIGVADPNELYQMGRSDAVFAAKPRLELSFGNLDTHRSLGATVEQQRIILEPLPEGQLPGIRRQAYMPAITGGPNYNFFSELQEHILWKSGCAPYAFVVRNSSSVAALDVRAKLRIRTTPGLVVRDHIPERPAKIMTGVRTPRINQDVDVQKRAEFFEIEATCGKVQPGAEAWTSDQLYVGTLDATNIVCEGRLFGDNFDPIPIRLEILSTPTTRGLTPKDLYEAAGGQFPDIDDSTEIGRVLVEWDPYDDSRD
jgi:hypothetical protein